MKKGISHEGLKIIACLTMLTDHIGYGIIYPIYNRMVSGQITQTLYHIYLLCRCIGRISLPIFAFLLVEGFHRTSNRKKYAMRLAYCAVLAEIPYNLMVSGTIECGKQSVMATLLLGFMALIVMEKCRNLTWKAVVAVPFAVLASVFQTDYGWAGVALVAIFELSRQMYAVDLIRFGALVVLFHYIPSRILWLGNISIPMQVLGSLAMLFIANYDGRKVTENKAVQWAFYLFYPVHMLVLWAIGTMIPEVFMMGYSIAL